MLISIRGNNGSGKSTLARRFLDLPHKPLYGVLGVQKPEAYRVTAPSERPIYLIGPYTTAYGGCDAIQPYDVMVELIQQYDKRGHVVFKGVLISDCYGRVGELLKRADSIVAFLDTPLEECLRRVQARRDARGDTRPFNKANTIKRHARIERMKAKMRAKGHNVIEVSSLDGFDTLMGVLQ